MTMRWADAAGKYITRATIFKSTINSLRYIVGEVHTSANLDKIYDMPSKSSAHHKSK